MDKGLLLSLTKTTLIIIFPFLSYLTANYDLLLVREFIYFTLIGSLIVFLVISLICAFLFILLSKRTRFAYIHQILFVFDITYLLTFLFLPIVDFGKVVVFFFGLTRGATGVYAVVCIATISFSFFISKYKFSRIFLFSFSCIVVSFNTIKIAWFITRPKPPETISREVVLFDKETVIRNRRNIYYVIMDAYSAPKILKEELLWDSGDFLTKLSDLGFYHAKNAFSPYPITPWTLAAIFTMDYVLDESKSKHRPYNGDFYPHMMDKLEVPNLIKTTKALGYEFYMFGSLGVECRERHVRCIDTERFIPYHITLFLSNTPIVVLYEKLYEKLFTDRSSFLRKSFERNDAISRALAYFRQKDVPNQPSFTFIHSMMPHMPYIFKSNCDMRDLSGTDLTIGRKGKKNIKYKEEHIRVIDNIQCANKRMTEFAEFITKKDPKAIVVFQGDHGLRYVNYHKGVSEEWVNKRNLILNMLRVPHRCKKWLYPEINNINSVRLALACAVDQAPRFTEDKAYTLRSLYAHDPNYEYIRRIQIKQ